MSRPPAQVVSWYATSNDETVYWSPALWRWNGSRFEPYVGKPWYSARANRHGLRSYTLFISYFWAASNGAPRYEVPFGRVPRGSYAIKQYYKWGSTGVVHEEWQYFQNFGQNPWCTL